MGQILDQLYTNQLYIILSHPQMGENIGAAARVMSNFGINNLRIILPRDGWPNEKAYEMAAHGKYILDKAEVYDNFNEAVADLNVLYATTANMRFMNKAVIELPNFNEGLKNLPNQKIGILFGRERTGLTNEEIVSANAILTIKTNEENPSLNLAQAVALVCYQLSSMHNWQLASNQQLLATKEELNHFFTHLEGLLDDNGFFKNSKMKPSMWRNIRNIFTKNTLTKQEVNTLRGILSSIGSKAVK
jgi:tRNA/rRNA methyltransferase